MDEITIEKLMEQAQCFASAWALVGTPFDNGNMPGQAKTEKGLLQDMLKEFESDVEKRSFLSITRNSPVTRRSDMSLLHGIDYEQTTILQLIQEAERQPDDMFDLVTLSLDSGRDLIVMAVSGENLDALTRVLEGLQEMKAEA